MSEKRRTRRSTLRLSESSSPASSQSHLNQSVDIEKEDRLKSGGPSSSPTNPSSSPSPMTRKKKPKDTPFTQQRLPAWQPILTPYNVIPALFVIALIFIPVGILFLVFTSQVTEYEFNYSSCLHEAPLDIFGPAPSNLGNVPFQWRRLSKIPSYLHQSSSDFDYYKDHSSDFCELRFKIDSDIDGPVFQYYGLSNYYQNQRLYVKSVDWSQLKGDARTYEDLAESCAPLVGPDASLSGNQRVYYPCGLIANSMFNDTFGSLMKMSGDKPEGSYQFLPKGIAWPREASRYGPSKYEKDQVVPPPFWKNNRKYVNAQGNYESLPDFNEDERFQVWMKVAGLPVFRKPFGKNTGKIPSGTYTVLIHSVFEVESYGAKKSFIISSTSWLGGKNPFLGYAYIVGGAIFLVLAIVFLVRHLISPRRLGDVKYLSWNSESRQNID